jgi:hypothetical protein
MRDGQVVPDERADAELSKIVTRIYDKNRQERLKPARRPAHDKRRKPSKASGTKGTLSTLAQV